MTFCRLPRLDAAMVKRVFWFVASLAMALPPAPLSVAAGQSGVVLTGAPSGTTSETNPEIHVTAPQAVAYKYSINGAPYSAERPIHTPITLGAGVRFGDRVFPAGTRGLFDYINLRAADASFTQFLNGIALDDVQSQLQITYVLNNIRAAVAAENILNLWGSGVETLDVALTEKTPSGNRYELSALAVTGGKLVRQSSPDSAKRFRLSLAPDRGPLTLTPLVNNGLTTITVNGQVLASGTATTISNPAAGVSILLQTIGPDTSHVNYEIEVAYDGSLDSTVYRSYYLRAFDPASAYVSIRNRGTDVVTHGMTFNNKLGLTKQEIIREIEATAPQYPGESMPRRVWRFIRDNRYHFDPLTGAPWFSSPALFFDSAGFGYCDDSAALFHELMTELGYTARLWDLTGHVIAEVRINERWEMWDPDLEVYYLNHDGLVAGVQDLAADPSLITNPQSPVQSTDASAYLQVVSDIYSSLADNFLYPPDPISEIPRTFQIPPGGAFEFPDLYDAPLGTLYGTTVPSYTNARLVVPEGFAGTLSEPLIIHSIGWSNSPRLSVITKNAAEVWDAQPTEASWTVDFVAPVTTPSQASGQYAADELVSLTVNEPATIYYTTDGSIPTEGSSVYVSPVAVVAGGSVKFFAVDPAGNHEMVRAYGPAVSQVGLQVSWNDSATASFSASAVGGSGTYEYRYFLRGADNVWLKVQPYSASPDWSWDKTGVAAGPYTVLVWARNAGAAVEYDAYAWVDLTITVNRAPVLANPGDQVNGDSAQMYADVVRADAPVAYWRLGEASGPTVADTAGNYSGSAAGGVTFGQSGALSDGNAAVQFDGTSGYVGVAAPPAMLAGDVTIEMWVNVSLATRQTLMSKGYLHEFELTLETDGSLNFYHGNGSTYQNVASAADAVIASSWMHVVVTREALTKTIRFYVNGVAKGSAVYSTTPTASPGPIWIGRNDGTQYVNGHLDEVALYSTALSPVQVATHYVRRASTGGGPLISLPLAASDVDGDGLTYAASGLPLSLAIDSVTGIISGTLTPASVGIHQVTATVSDGRLATSETFVWTVTHVNLPPDLLNPGPQIGAENTTVSLQLTASDPEADTVTYSTTDLPASLTLDPATGLLSGTLSFNSAGTYLVKATASDGTASRTQAFTWTVANVNRAPVLQNPGARTDWDSSGYAQGVLSDLPIAYWRLDDATGTTVADSSGTNPGTLFGGVSLGQSGALSTATTATSFNGSNGYIRVPNPAAPLAGDLTIEMWVNVSLATRQTLISKSYLYEFELTLETSGHLNFYQGNGTTVQNVVSGQAITSGNWRHVVVTRQASTKTIRFYVDGVAKGSGVYTATPAASTRALSIGRAEDGNQHVTGRLDEVALYPTVLSAAQVAAHYGLRTSAVSDTVVQLPLIASDPDGDGLTYGATGLPAGLTINAATGIVSGTLSPASAGTHQVTASASDGSLSASQTFTWTVTHFNRNPILTNPGSQASVENASISLQLGASDPDGDVLTYGATGLPASLSLDSATGQVSGTLSFSSAGTYQVTATVSDGACSNSQTFNWTIADTNRDPVLVNPGNQTNGDMTGYAPAVLSDAPAAYWRLGETADTGVANSAGIDPQNWLGGVTVGGVALGQSGALGDGNPAMLFNGSTGFVRIANSTAVQIAGDLTLEVWVNVSLATRQTLVSKESRREFELTLERDGRLNFYHGNGAGYEGVLSAFGAITANTWQHVVVTRTAATKTIRFYVNGVARGSGSYALTPTTGTNAISIGRSGAGVQYVAGRLDDVALYPTALSEAQISAHYAQRTSAIAPASVSLQLLASDPDGVPLTYSVTGLPSGLTINSATGLISGTLASTSAGTYQVTAAASDGSLSNSRTFTWTITHVNRAPALSSPGNQASAENDTISLQMAASDPDGDTLTFSATGLPASLALDPATGLVAGSLSFASAGTYVVTVTVLDGRLTSGQTFTWTVANTNRAPVLTSPGNQTHGDLTGYAPAVLADAPAGYWRLAETAGSVAGDSAGINAGTLFGGVTLAQDGALGDGNRAMLFNGSTGYIRIANSSAALLAGDLTLEMWINVSLATRQTLISKDYLREFELTLETDGRLNFYNGNGTTYEGVLSDFGAVTRNIWQHVVVTRTAATKTIRFYTNGVAKGTGSLTKTPSVGANAVSIGRSAAGVQYVNGRLDEVALYPAVLTAVRIAAHYAERTSAAAATTIALQLVASDPDGDGITYNAVGLPPPLTIDAATGLISGTLAQASVGTYQVTVTASDASDSYSQTFAWTVMHIN